MPFKEDLESQILRRVGSGSIILHYLHKIDIGERRVKSD